MFNLIKNLLSPRNLGLSRSTSWRKVRKEFLKKNPVCAVTGSKKKLEVHHIIPFHISPELELEESNLITLSRRSKGSNIHLLFGHYGNYKKDNPNIVKEAREWNKKLN